jgi:hypothetical protein
LSGYEKLLMRGANDYRHDTITKPEQLELSGYVPSIIFEDRTAMVEKWRELGYCCCQVASGDF